MVFNRHFQQYFSYIMAVSFIGGGIWSTRVQRSKYNCIVVALQGVRVILMLFIFIYEY